MERTLNSNIGQKAGKQPVKILFVIDKLVPAGTQKNLLEIISRLDRRRFLPSLAVFQLGPEADWFTSRCGLKPIFLKVNKAYDPSGLKAFLSLYRLLRKERFDLAQLHFLQAEMLALPAARLAGGVKVMTTRRDEGFWRTSRQLALSRFFARRSDAVLVNSLAVEKAVEEKEQVAPAKVRVIYNGVDTAVFGVDPMARLRIRAELGLREQDFLVGTVSNMRYEIKGYRNLIEGASLLSRRNPHVKFLFAGDGPLRAEYEKLASSLGVREKISFSGVRQDIPALLNALDLVCQPSLSEGFSNTLLEAMASGKAVVATAVGGNPEAVDDGVTGFLIPPKDSSAIAEKISLLAQDPVLCAGMAEAARMKIEREFSMEAMVRNYENFYECLSGRSGQAVL